MVARLGANRDGRRVLTRFGAILAVIVCAILALVALTPLRNFPFDQITGLVPDREGLCALWIRFCTANRVRSIGGNSVSPASSISSAPRHK